MLQPQNVITVSGLKVFFPGQPGYQAIKGISFDIASGKTLAVVGHSGSGKSVTALALMGLLPKTTRLEGSIELSGYGNLLEIEERAFRNVRGKEIAMIFQEPMSSLNPLKTCGKQLMESIQIHQQINAQQARIKALEWFEKVKLPQPEKLLYRFPHQLSGGQKQRVMIAMAMCNHPSLLIADEPTTALDVTVQKEIILLMKELQKEYGTAILFITHDLALAATIADDYLKMEEGKIVEGNIHIQKQFPVPVSNLSPGIPPLLKVEELKVYFPAGKAKLGKTSEYYKAVDGVSFELFEGEIMGLVGESGCGKSTLSKSIIGLQEVTSGNILFRNKEITHYNNNQWRKLRKDIQVIFQDPFSALNQRMKVGDALAEPIIVHKLSDGRNVDKLVDELLAMVQLPAFSKNKYPHEFSGGQRQRICIARALAVNPQLVICDESVSALDVKIQEQILELLLELQKEKKLTYLFITHDLNVVKRISSRVMVMQKGRIVEQGNTDHVMNHPKESYTRMLLDAVPHL